MKLHIIILSLLCVALSACSSMQNQKLSMTSWVSCSHKQMQIDGCEYE